MKSVFALPALCFGLQFKKPSCLASGLHDGTIVPCVMGQQSVLLKSRKFVAILFGGIKKQGIILSSKSVKVVAEKTQLMWHRRHLCCLELCEQ